jgi:hypothetical protein
MLLRIFALSMVFATGLSAFGVLGTLVIAKSGGPKDAALVIQALLHACMGCIVSLCIWAAGAGVTRLILRDAHARLAQILVPAFPTSLLVLAALAAISIAIPAGRIIALVLWVACLLPLLRWRPPREELAASFRATLGIVPFSVAFGIWLALLWHGPTETLPGSPSGDLSFYAGSIWSLASQPYPFIDLGYADGGTRSFFNNLYPALGAALLYLPNFDPFLFLLATGGTSYVLLTTLMLQLYAADRISGTPGPLDVLVLILSVLIAARYPYWVVESIPMVFVPALTIAVWWMAERGQSDFKWSIASMSAGLTGSILSKVTTAAVLVPLGAAGLLKQFRILPLRVRAIVLCLICIFGVYSIAMLLHFLPMFVATPDVEVGPESLRNPQWYFACRDIAAAGLVVLAWLIADGPVALALTIGLATFLLFSFVFQVNFVAAALLLGLMMFTGPAKSPLARALALAAFAASMPAAVLSDPAGSSSGIVWIFCLGGAALVAVLSAIKGATSLLTFRATAFVAIATIAIAGLGLVGVAGGFVIIDSGWRTHGSELSPEVRDIWSAVRRLTPPDALIFTDQVDETINLLGGWNTYAFSGQRQIYLSSYYTAPELRNDQGKLRKLLSINASVLTGTMKPVDVPTKARREQVFAVIAADRVAPRSWEVIYTNKRYAIFKIIS